MAHFLDKTMRILAFILGSIIWLWLVYALTLVLRRAAKTRVARMLFKQYAWHTQPSQFILTVLVQLIFWLGLVGWWLNGVWNLFIKLNG